MNVSIRLYHYPKLISQLNLSLTLMSPKLIIRNERSISLKKKKKKSYALPKYKRSSTYLLDCPYDSSIQDSDLPLLNEIGDHYIQLFFHHLPLTK